MNPTAEEMLAFIQANEASLSFATAEPEELSWRCYVYGQHFPTPDIREHSTKCGYGRTAVEAISACMNDKTDYKVV